MKTLLTALLTCITLSGCSQIAPYREALRPNEKLCVAERDPSECPTEALFLTPTGDGGPDVPIAIFEFDDQGAL